MKLKFNQAVKSPKGAYRVRPQSNSSREARKLKKKDKKQQKIKFHTIISKYQSFLHSIFLMNLKEINIKGPALEQVVDLVLLMRTIGYIFVENARDLHHDDLFV